MSMRNSLASLRHVCSTFIAMMLLDTRREYCLGALYTINMSCLPFSCSGIINQYHFLWLLRFLKSSFLTNASKVRLTLLNMVGSTAVQAFLANFCYIARRNAPFGTPPSS